MKHMDRTFIYPGTNPTTVFIHSPGSTAFRSAGTNPMNVPADGTLTMMHHVDFADAVEAAALRRQPLNCALPSAMQLAKVRFFLSIQ